MARFHALRSHSPAGFSPLPVLPRPGCSPIGRVLLWPERPNLQVRDPLEHDPGMRAPIAPQERTPTDGREDLHLRYHPARRRTVRRRRLHPPGEAGDRAPARKAGGRHHRSRLPMFDAGRPGGGPRRLARGAQHPDLRARPRREDRHRYRLGGRERSGGPAHPRLHQHGPRPRRW